MRKWNVGDGGELEGGVSVLSERGTGALFSPLFFLRYSISFR